MSHSYILDFPKSIFFNFKALPFHQAYKLPFRISFQTRLVHIKKGIIHLDCDIHHNMIHIGALGVDGVTNHRSNYIRLGEVGKCSVTFRGSAKFAQGALINVDRGHLLFGKNFGANNNFYISCNKKITFGDNVSLGWCVNCMDSDNHTVTDTKHTQNNSPKGIYIGDHVWIGSYTHLLKGAHIPNECVVAYNSLVTKAFFNEHSLIGGHPAKTIKEEIVWDSEAIY